jgi:hypothetical protein
MLTAEDDRESRPVAEGSDFYMLITENYQKLDADEKGF